MSRRRVLSTGTSLLCFLLLLGFPTSLQSQLKSVRVQVIDRGQADGILIRTPQDTQWVVIDAGTNMEQAEAMATEWGVDSVDVAITSHRHYDHYGGMDDVLEDFPVGLYLANLEDCPDRVHDGTIRDHLEAAGIGRRRWDEWQEKWKPGEGDVVVDTVGVGGGVLDRLEELDESQS